MGPWQILESIILEDTAGNISRILGFPPDWAEQIKERYGPIAFSVAKYLRFFIPKIKELGPWHKHDYDNLVWDATDTADHDPKFKDAGFRAMITALRANPSRAKKINGAQGLESFLAAVREVVADHSKKMVAGRVVMSFSDGWRWVGLNSSSSEDEGKKMGHCGRASSSWNELISLRDPSGNPHVTIEYSQPKNAIYQIRGKQNADPHPKYQPYIDAFLKKTNAAVVDED